MMFTEVENFSAVFYPIINSPQTTHENSFETSKQASIQAESIQIIIINKIFLVGSVVLGLRGTEYEGSINKD